MFRKPPGVPSVPPPEIYDIWDEGDAVVIEPGIPGIDDEEEDLPPYHTYYQFIRPPPTGEIDLPHMEEDIAPEEEEEEEEDEVNQEEEEAAPAEVIPPKPVEIEPPPKPTTLQQRMLAIAGQDVNNFMKEMEVNYRQKEMNRQSTYETRKARMEAGDIGDDAMETDYSSFNQHHPAPFQRPPMMPGYPMGPPPVYGGFVPPPALGSRLPPGPPPRLPQGIVPRMVRPPGMPPPPPPGLRPGAPSGISGGNRGPPASSSSSSSSPSTSSIGKAPNKSTIIEAKPQMRNLSADLTRFVPTAIKLKKDAPPPRKDALKSVSSTPHIEWRTPQVQVTIFYTRFVVILHYITSVVHPQSIHLIDCLVSSLNLITQFSFAMPLVLATVLILSTILVDCI